MLKIAWIEREPCGSLIYREGHIDENGETILHGYSTCETDSYDASHLGYDPALASVITPRHGKVVACAYGYGG